MDSSLDVAGYLATKLPTYFKIKSADVEILS